MLFHSYCYRINIVEKWIQTIFVKFLFLLKMLNANISLPQGLPHRHANPTATMATRLLPLHTTNSPQSARPCSLPCHILQQQQQQRAVAVPLHIVALASIRPSLLQTHPPQSRRIYWRRPNPIDAPPLRLSVELQICAISTSNSHWTRRHPTHRPHRRHRPITIRWHPRRQSALNTRRWSRTATRSPMWIVSMANLRISVIMAVRSVTRAIAVWDWSRQTIRITIRIDCRCWVRRRRKTQSLMVSSWGNMKLTCILSLTLGTINIYAAWYFWRVQSNHNKCKFW